MSESAAAYIATDCEACHGTGRFFAAPSDECAMCLGTGSERVAAIRSALKLVCKAARSEYLGFSCEGEIRDATLKLAKAVGTGPIPEAGKR